MIDGLASRRFTARPHGRRSERCSGVSDARESHQFPLGALPRPLRPAVPRVACDRSRVRARFRSKGYPLRRPCFVGNRRAMHSRPPPLLLLDQSDTDSSRRQSLHEQDLRPCGELSWLPSLIWRGRSRRGSHPSLAQKCFPPRIWTSRGTWPLGAACPSALPARLLAERVPRDSAAGVGHRRLWWWCRLGQRLAAA